mgnify:CR=1 FL=1|jgi:hypothetical protein
MILSRKLQYTPKMTQAKTVFLYIYTIFKNPHTLGPIPVPTETKTSNPMQSYTVARGEWK